MLKKLFLILTIILIPTLCYAVSDLPILKGYVTDLAEILTTEQELKLNTTLTSLYENRSIEIAVLTIKSLDGNNIRDFALETGRKNGVGSKENDTGIIFLVSLEDREVAIELGYGIEGAITDYEANKIIQNITPYLAKKNYFEAFTLGITQIENQLINEQFDTPEVEPTYSEKIYTIVFALSFILIWSSSILARSSSFYLGGVVAGLTSSFTSFIFSMGHYSIFIILISVIIGALFDKFISDNFKSAKKV